MQNSFRKLKRNKLDFVSTNSIKLIDQMSDNVI